jgi:hypothetical protein
MSPAPGVVRATANNQLGNKLVPSAVANRRHRARSACGRVYQLTPAIDGSLSETPSTEVVLYGAAFDWPMDARRSAKVATRGPCSAAI